MSWPVESPPALVTRLDDVPEGARPYYEPAPEGGWILRDMLDHIMSVHTPDCLKPVYQIRQYSHRRASFLKRHLVPEPARARLALYPERLADYQASGRADALHADLLYDPAGRLYDEFRDHWLA